MQNAPTQPQKNINLTGILVRAARAWLVYPGLTALAILSLFVQQAFSTYFSYSLRLIIDNVLNHTNQPSLGLMVTVKDRSGADHLINLLDDRAQR